MNYRKLRADIEKVVGEYTFASRSDDSYEKQTTLRLVMRVAFGVAYSVKITSESSEPGESILLPVDWYSHLLMGLPKSLQFGWLKPKFRKVSVTNYTTVNANVVFPNKPIPLNYEDDTYTHVEYI
jgi:hypothetical protein